MLKNFTIAVLSLALACLQACSSYDEIPFIEFDADFEAPLVVRVGESVTFRPKTSTSGASSFLWEFGDALQQTSNLASPTFSYDSIGNYTVKLHVSINKTTGLEDDSIQKTIIVLPETQTPDENQAFIFGQESNDERGYAIYPLASGGLIVAGQKDINTLFVAKIGANQQILSGWPREFNNFGTGQIIVRSVRETIGGGVLMLGYFQYQSNDNDAFLLKTNPFGNEVWRTLVRSDKDEKFVDALEDETGALLVVGTFATAGRPSIIINRYSEQGKLAAPFIVPRELCNSCSAESVIETQDGGFVIAGRQIDQPLLIKFDAQGNYQGKSTLNILGLAHSVTQLPNGKYVTVGEINTLRSDSSNAFIAQFDIIGNAEEWRQNMVLYKEVFVDVWSAQNGDLIAVGRHQNPLSGQDVMLGRFDRNGGQLKQLRLLSSSGNNFAAESTLDRQEDRLNIIGSESSNTTFSERRNLLLIRLEANFWEE